MSFRIIRDNLARVRADAIVNTANPEVAYGRGTDSAIYRAAGLEQLLAARERIGSIEPGTAAVTPAFNLNARYIIHTVGPGWQGGDHGETEVLSSCYRESLLLADSLGCDSIAFPLISSGNYGFPKPLALETALAAISEFSKVSEMDVTLVVFDRESFDLSSSLDHGVQQYIDENYVRERMAEEYPAGSPSGMSRATGSFNAPLTEISESDKDAADDEMLPLGMLEEDNAALTEEEFDAYFEELYEASYSLPSAPAEPSAPYPSYQKKSSLDELVKGLGQTFQERLLSLIDERGYTDTQVYKRANIDRKLFSKIRCNQNYKPSKATALALAISLRLSLDETVDLIGRAGLALSPSSISDLIVKYCILNQIYDIYEVNAILFKYDQQLLC